MQPLCGVAPNVTSAPGYKNAVHSIPKETYVFSRQIHIYYSVLGQATYTSPRHCP